MPPGRLLARQVVKLSDLQILCPLEPAIADGGPIAVPRSQEAPFLRPPTDPRESPSRIRASYEWLPHIFNSQLALRRGISHRWGARLRRAM